MIPKVSFGLKKKESLKTSESTSRNLSSCFSSLFDQASGAVDESVTSRSIITSLGAEGFQSTFTEVTTQGIKPIPCPVLLPAPNRKDEKEHHIIEIVPKKSKKSHHEKKESNKKQPDANGLLNSDSYGLVSVNRASSDNYEEDIGPPTTTRVSKRDMTSLIDSHRGVVISRGVIREPEPSVTSYDEVPVENFGLAMLMGMGYDPTQPNQSQPLLLKSRVYTKAGLGADKEFEEHKKKIEREIAAAATGKEPGTLRHRQGRR